MARSGIVYGVTGTRKTTQVKWFSHYIAETTGKATMLITMDGGGAGPCQPEIDAGMIEAFFCDSTVVPLAILRKVSQGYWPADISDPYNESGLTRMNFEKFGGIAVEGWSSISAAAMRYLPDTNKNVGGENRRLLGGFDNNIVVDGKVVTESFLSSTRGDYGFVQNFLYGLVMNFNSLPLRYVLYTALESKTEDDDRSTIYGPAIVGKKATSQCGAWVGDMIHCQDYSVNRTEKVPDPSDPSKLVDQITQDIVVRFYYRKHPDPATGILFPAKPRVTPQKIKELERTFPGGYFESDDKRGLDRYLHLVDELSAGQADTLKGWREKIDQKLGRNAPTKLEVARVSIPKEQTQ